MENPGFAAIPGLLIALAMVPVIGFAIVRVIKYMLDGEMDAAAGLGAIVALVGVMVVTIMSKSNVVAGVVLVCVISLIVFFPFAVDTVANADVRGIDIDKLDRVHKEIIARPENIASYFALAEIVHNLGLEGHAIAIAERTLEQLSNDVDPLKNQSLRDVFKAEESRAKQWRRNLSDSDAFRPVACPRCKCKNEAGTIACAGCKGPFLLDLARGIDPRQRVRSKLVLGFAVVAGFLTGTVYAWSVIEGDLRWAVFGAGLATVAGVFTWMFQHRRLGRR